MQSKIFSRIIKGVVVLIIVYTLVQLSSEARKVVPFPQDTFTSSSTPSNATSTSAVLNSRIGFATSTLAHTLIRVGKYSINAEIADTEASRTQGLSGRMNLAADTGLLFVFGSPDIYGFWMKDMNFPIDIVWIDSKKKVVGVERSINPESFPEIYYASSSVLYVLELNSMAAQKYGMSPVTQLVF